MCRRSHRRHAVPKSLPRKSNAAHASRQRSGPCLSSTIRRRSASAANGPLAGLTFAVKDLYDVAGYPTGGGHPLMRQQSDIKTINAPAVQTLLDAGARFVGKTHTDEFAYSMNGENFHYGTPINVRAPGRIPGGSSSGSAAATSAGLVDFALGSDTGGSVRAPASYNGLIGLRPDLRPDRYFRGRCRSPTASTPSAGSPATPTPSPASASVLLGEDDAEPAADPLHRRRRHPRAAAGRSRGSGRPSATPRIAAHLEPAGAVIVSEEGLAAWRMIFRTMQAYEAWQAQWRLDHGQPADLRAGRARALRMGEPRHARRNMPRAGARRRQRARADHAGCSATTRCSPSRRRPASRRCADLDGEELESYRNRALSMLCTAGLAGLPQINLPLAEHEGCPLGVSLVAPAGRDRALIELARRILAG